MGSSRLFSPTEAFQNLPLRVSRQLYNSDFLTPKLIQARTSMDAFLSGLTHNVGNLPAGPPGLTGHGPGPGPSAVTRSVTHNRIAEIAAAVAAADRGPEPLRVAIAAAKRGRRRAGRDGGPAQQPGPSGSVAAPSGEGGGRPSNAVTPEFK